MKRFALAAIVGVLASMFAASLASGHTGTQPTVTIEADCQAFPGFNSVNVTLSGFPPNTPFEGTLLLPGGGGIGPVQDHTDANGEFVAGPVGTTSPGTFIVIIEWSGGTLIESLDVDCTKPTSKRDCKRGGWRQFDFRNQGQCVAWVEHHNDQGHNPPAGKHANLVLGSINSPDLAVRPPLGL